MNITSAQYVSFASANCGIIAIIDGQELSVPLDPNNRHYAAILAAVEAGKLTIEEAV